MNIKFIKKIKERLLQTKNRIQKIKQLPNTTLPKTLPEKLGEKDTSEEKIEQTLRITGSKGKLGIVDTIGFAMIELDTYINNIISMNEFLGSIYTRPETFRGSDEEFYKMLGLHNLIPKPPKIISKKHYIDSLDGMIKPLKNYQKAEMGLMPDDEPKTNDKGRQTEEKAEKTNTFNEKPVLDTNLTFVPKSIQKVNRIVKIPETSRNVKFYLFRTSDIQNIFENDVVGTGEHHEGISMATLQRSIPTICKLNIKAGSVINITYEFYPVFINTGDDPTISQSVLILENI